MSYSCVYDISNEDYNVVPATNDEHEEEEFCESYCLIDIILSDDREEFVWALKHNDDSYFTYGSNYSHYHPQEILSMVCEHRSIRCAEALISGETPVAVDLNLPSWEGMPPLHHLAYFAYEKNTPAMVELLLYYGARTDIRCVGNPNFPDSPVEKCANRLPLEIAIEKMNLGMYYSSEWSQWTPRNSIYKLITILCLPRMQNHLEIIAMLSGTTKETGEILLEYARKGRVIELATLLIAAPEDKLKGVIDELRQDLDTIQTDPLLVNKDDQGEKLVAVQRLLEVFDKAGSEISAYIKSNRFYDTDDKTWKLVINFLRKAGFDVMDSEVSLDDDERLKKCQKYHCLKASDITTRCVVDYGMAHYGKSGYRWNSCKSRYLIYGHKNDPWLEQLNHPAYIEELENEVEALKEEKVRIAEKRQGLNLHVWMDDELWDVLEKDDREEFLSLIDRKLDCFHSRQQQLLYAVCSFGSIKCAEALVKGETSLTVDLNLPCTDTGLYPLHCAALSLFPSITELFLYHGARTDVRFTPSIPSDVFPQEIFKEHANKLPLHMALHAISNLPWIREWSLKDSVANLIALLCLPRMKNPLETLSMLAMTTKETRDEFIQLSMEGKIVQEAALQIAAHKKLKYFEVSDRAVSPVLLGEDAHKRERAQRKLYDRFEVYGEEIAAYMQEDKHNVTKYEAIEEINGTMFGSNHRADLSIYNWYREEESTYPSEAPYEQVRLPHDDIGMEHYGKYRFRWKSSARTNYVFDMYRQNKRKDYQKEMESERSRLQDENWLAREELKQFTKPADTDYRYIVRQGVPIASPSYFSHNAVNAQNFSSTRGMSSMASVLKSASCPDKPRANKYTMTNHQRFLSSLNQSCGGYPINLRRPEGHVSTLLRAKPLCFMASMVSMQSLPSRRAMKSMPSISNAYKAMI